MKEKYNKENCNGDFLQLLMEMQKTLINNLKLQNVQYRTIAIVNR